GGNASLPIEALLVLAGVVGLTILVLSDRVRQKTRRFVSRHFRRPLHDYRKVWLTFTERTTSLMDETDFCRAVAKLVAENFEVLSATVWLVDQEKDRLAFAASTALSESNASDLANSLDNIHDMIQAMRAHPHPVCIDPVPHAAKHVPPFSGPRLSGRRRPRAVEECDSSQQLD